ncbi:hypothetical protein [Corynebacterium hindlerae]|uniref:hypothetical protein n=1 Tax=Corynebacterium hindlerae TaxID=699041 RepID=UPI0031B68DC3
MTLELSLGLRRTTDLDLATLGCSGFAAAPATVALSEDIRTVLHQDGRPLGHGELSAHGLTTLTAWNATARRLLDAASDDFGCSFLVRHLHDPRLPRSIQIRPKAGTASEWLGHPLLFTRLHAAACQVFGTTDAVFHCLSEDCVVATCGPVLSAELAPVLHSLGVTVDSDYSFTDLSFHQGFPVTLGLWDEEPAKEPRVTVAVEQSARARISP